MVATSLALLQAGIERKCFAQLPCGRYCPAVGQVGSAWVVVSLLVAGCGAPPPSVPSAVVKMDPEVLCAGDDFRTPVRLDGSESAARLTLVPVPGDPDAEPLRFEWTLSGADWVLLEGDLASEQLVVATAADRPLHVELTVRDAEGGVATALETVPITVPDPVTGACVE